MDIYQLCKAAMNPDPTQFYNSTITAVATLIAGQMLLFCTCIVLLRRTSALSNITAEEHKAFIDSTALDKIKAICMHGIVSSKGYFSVKRFRQVFLLSLAPAR
jgi:hypothetical protein